MTDSKETHQWIDKKEYPFKAKFIQSEHGKIHYLDEGSGQVLLFVHGNPNWSFGYRKLIQHFSKNYRCVAIDHIGFGLSDKPFDVSYLPQFHSKNLEWVIRKLDLKDVIIFMHDWGCPISIHYAERHPANVKGIVAFNGWFWSVKNNKTLKLFSIFMGSVLGKNLCKHFNFFPKVLMKADVGDKNRFSKVIHEHYIKPFPKPENRKGTWVFPKSFLSEDQWLSDLWEKRNALKPIPVLLLWGLKDKAFPESFLEKWQTVFPENTATKFEYSGHNSPEEIGKEAIPFVEEFIEKKLFYRN